MVTSPATLSLFAVYSAAPLPPDDPSAASSRRTDAELEASKVLYFSSPGESVTDERKARLMGTILGMADFARMLAPSAEPVRIVHSLKKRMVYHEPEPGLFLHVTIALPRAVRSRAASIVTTASATSSTVPVTPTTPSQPYAIPDDAVLLAGLAAGYAEFRLEHGTLGSYLEMDNGPKRLREVLEPFWTTWLETWTLDEPHALERIVGGLPKSSIVSPLLTPLITQFSFSNPNTWPLLLHSSQVLHAPTDCPVPLPALASHLIASRPASTTLSLRPETPETSEHSKWAPYYTLGLSNLTFNNTASSTTPSATPPPSAEKAAEKEKSSLTSAWGVRMPSWGRPKHHVDLDPAKTTELPSFAQPSPPLSSTNDKLADEDELAAAMEADLPTAVPATPINDEDSTASVSVGEELERSSVMHVYGDENVLYEAHTFDRGSLTLAVVTSPLDPDVTERLAARSARLLEAIETVLEGQVPPTELFPFPHLVANPPFSRSTLPAQPPSELLDAHALVAEGAEEVLIRTGGPQQQWVGATAFPDGRGVLAVLPGKVGKDGSLVEAAEELRKLVRIRDEMDA